MLYQHWNYIDIQFQWLYYYNTVCLVVYEEKRHLTLNSNNYKWGIIAVKKSPHTNTLYKVVIADKLSTWRQFLVRHYGLNKKNGLGRHYITF